jgi:hypothetical protein
VEIGTTLGATEGQEMEVAGLLKTYETLRHCGEEYTQKRGRVGSFFPRSQNRDLGHPEC